MQSNLRRHSQAIPYSPSAREPPNLAIGRLSIRPQQQGSHKDKFLRFADPQEMSYCLFINQPRGFITGFYLRVGNAVFLIIHMKENQNDEPALSNQS